MSMSSRLKKISFYLILITLFNVSCTNLKMGNTAEKDPKRGEMIVQCDPSIIAGEISEVSQILSSRRFEEVHRSAPCSRIEVLKAVYDEACKLNANKVFLQEVVESEDETACFRANAIFTRWEPSNLIYTSKSDSGNVVKESNPIVDERSVLTIYADEHINREYYESYYRDKKFASGPVFKVISTKELNELLTSKKLRSISISKKFGDGEEFYAFSLLPDRITSSDGMTVYFKDIRAITVYNKESHFSAAVANFISTAYIFSFVGGVNYIFGEAFPVKPMLTVSVAGGLFGLIFGEGKPTDYHTIYFVVHTPK